MHAEARRDGVHPQRWRGVQIVREPPFVYDFGERASSIDGVRYGDFGEPEFDVTPTCSMQVPHTRIVCTTTEGADPDSFKVELDEEQFGPLGHV